MEHSQTLKGFSSVNSLPDSLVRLFAHTRGRYKNAHILTQGLKLCAFELYLVETVSAFVLPCGIEQIRIKIVQY